MPKSLQFELSGDKPKYQGVVEQLGAAIGRGVWSDGDKLPTNRELAAQFGVTIGTVSKAMGEALRLGLIETRVGSGTFVKKPAAVLANEHKPAERLDLSLNVPPLSPVRETLTQAMQLHHKLHGAASAFSYVDTREISRYHKTAAHWLNSTGTPTKPEQVVLTAGVHQGLIAAFQTLASPGDTVLCDVLGYTGFQRIATMRGVTLVGVACDEEGMRPDSLEENVKTTGAKVLLAHPVLQNPLATVQSEARRAQIAAVCQRHDLYVIEDGINVLLADPDTPSLTALMPERTIHLAGWSKSLSSGFRLGYAVVPEPWRGAFRDAVVGAQWFPPGFYAEMLELMHQEGLVEHCVKAHRVEASARRQLLRDLLPSAVMQGIGYHAWLPCGAQHRSADISELASRRNVAVSAGYHFAVDAKFPGTDGVRISLGRCEDRADLKIALSTLASIVMRPAPSQRADMLAPAV
jgi:DNA-binding transcriptional MocR family regulator